MNTFINTFDTIIDHDYEQYWINLLTIGAVCAVILGELYHLIRKIKFSTPLSMSTVFYIGINLTPSGDNDERFGLCINGYYLGVYDNTAQWGQLDETLTKLAHTP